MVVYGQDTRSAPITVKIPIAQFKSFVRARSKGNDGSFAERVLSGTWGWGYFYGAILDSDDEVAHGLAVHGYPVKVWVRNWRNEKGPDFLWAVHNQGFSGEITLEVVTPAVKLPLLGVNRPGDQVNLFVLIDLSGIAVGQSFGADHFHVTDI